VDEPADAPVVIRSGTAADADAAARLHAGLISDGFLAQLGPRFLGHLYRCVARGPDSFLLLADAGDAGGRPGIPPLAGFLAGALDLKALYRRFAWRHGPAAALGSLPQLVGALPRVWETLRHGAGAGASAGGGAELLAIAVDPAWRGRHVGTLLVDGFLDEIGRRGVADAQVVVGAGNAAAVALYGRAGFRPAETFELHRGTTSLVMRRPG
jgi:ribosomal protein S18 acetylase RimI-like enzyme